MRNEARHAPPLRTIRPGPAKAHPRQAERNKIAKKRGAWHTCRLAFNPSPCDGRIERCDLTKVWTLLLNEVEGGQITGEREPEAMLSALSGRMPEAALVLALGEKGVLYRKGGERLACSACATRVVDTTAAGDTFTGYFLAAVAEGMPVSRGLERACRAADITVSRAGAAVSIPYRKEVAP